MNTSFHQADDLGLPQVTSRFSKVMRHPKREVFWLPEWPAFSITTPIVFSLTGDIDMQDNAATPQAQIVKEWFRGHETDRVLRCFGEEFTHVWLPHHHYKSLAEKYIQRGAQNECCDMAGAHQNECECVPRSKLKTVCDFHMDSYCSAALPESWCTEQCVLIRHKSTSLFRAAF